MNDNVIMKALECCNAEYNVCEECPFKDTGYCERHIIENAYDLIKRQQAEIEKARAEAIKEFAGRLGEYIEYRYNENCDFVPYVRLSDIEKVVYEMVGTEKGQKITAQEYYALKMLILVALNSKECKNNAVMYDRASGFKMPMSEVIGIAVEYLANFDNGVIEKTE